jgi:general secretion pathway protein F
VHLIAVGERSGRLVEVLTAVVAEARARLEQRMGLVTALLAPILILVVGSLIGTVIYSVFSALLDINEIAF